MNIETLLRALRKCEYNYGAFVQEGRNRNMFFTEPLGIHEIAGKYQKRADKIESKILKTFDKEYIHGVIAALEWAKIAIVFDEDWTMRQEKINNILSGKENIEK